MEELEKMSEEEILETIMFIEYVEEHPEEFQDVEITHFQLKKNAGWSNSARVKWAEHRLYFSYCLQPALFTTIFFFFIELSRNFYKQYNEKY